ncbi:hypothetical protein L1987_47246 [Smallanthus sonchifolius]|uniref:Uncharacterized protein n=1 Tax=Smallanthus sonchifolius TaxID=185202 RepID=A0ACB9G327_9ASTR|nr:hypothetical protein L1987_47246 [Smallanthus sonchifolius]
MGSLMAGWRSHVHHLQSERNRSLTKEEIASFWRSKKIEEEERFFLKASYKLSKEDKRDVDDVVREEESMEPLLKKHGWWISSNRGGCSEARGGAQEPPSFEILV